MDEHSTTARRINPVLASVVAALGGLLFGYDTGVMSGALLFVAPEFEMSAFEQGWVTSVLLVGAAVGAVFGGRIADVKGRKSTLLSAGVLFILGSLGCAAAPGISVLTLSRVLLGLAVGIVSIVVPMYIAEIAPPRNRGRLVSLNTLMIVVGQLLAYMVNSAIAPWGNWRLMLGLAAVPAVFFVVGMALLPDSRPLNKPKEGVDSDEGFIAMSRHGWVRRGVGIAVVLGVVQQITGVNAIVYFAPKLMNDVGLSQTNSVYTSMVIGVVSVIACAVGLKVIDKLGRRRLLIGGLIVNTCSLVVLAVAYNTARGSESLAAVLLAVMAVFIASQQAAVSPATWLVVSEIVPQKARGVGMGLAGLALWSSNWAVAQFFLPLVETVGAAWVFTGFAACGVAAWAFVYREVPETKGRSLAVIERQLRRGA